MNRFLNFINIPQHLKRYFLKRKIQNHKGSKQNKNNKGLIKVINFLIIVSLLGELTYLNLRYENSYLFFSSIAVVTLVGGFFLIKTLKKMNQDGLEYKTIEKLVLKDEDEKIITDWDIKNKTALLIGKEEQGNGVDIDLSAATYSSLISREHGVLNNAEEKWYFEDLNSLNGSGIRRKHNNEKFKVNPEQPYKLNSGDVLYIANTKLIVQ
ncbi:MAG: FHA domain-containing protein [Bacillota bacterium]